MSLPFLYEAPTDAASWQAWGFNHAANHYDWVFYAKQQKNQNLQQFQLNPINPDALGFWLYNHQAAHNQINAVLGTSGYDLLTLDWQDPDQFQEWLNWNATEHGRISQALGVG